MAKLNLIIVGRTGLVEIIPFRTYRQIGTYLDLHPTTVSKARKEARPMLSKTDPQVAYYVEKAETETDDDSGPSTSETD